jgi:hypothetical protein
LICCPFDWDAVNKMLIAMSIIDLSELRGLSKFFITLVKFH